MSKFGLSNEDIADFEQEMLIKNWLKDKDIDFKFNHISSTGQAKNTLIKSSISLDQKCSDESKNLFSNIIADQKEQYTESEDPENVIIRNLNGLGFKDGVETWLVKILKLSESLSYKHYLKYRKNLAWLKR